MIENRHDAEPTRWHRFVAIGDSFTEGVGDPEPTYPGGLRGWADRVAEVLAEHDPDFAYANLAVRGKLHDQVRDEQLEPALSLRPDLLTISSGGNDMLRLGADPDAVAARFDRVVAKLRAHIGTVVIFTGFDPRFNAIMSAIRGRVAIYNENLRAIAESRDCIVADLWGLRSIQDPRMWSEDRLHLNPHGHHEVARLVLGALGAEHDLIESEPEPAKPRGRRDAIAGDLLWAREYFVPWVLRRLRRVSSGDGLMAKRPTPLPPLGAVAEPEMPAPGASQDTVGGTRPSTPSE